MKKRLFIIDDDLELIKVLKKFLSLEGYIVNSYKSSEEALKDVERYSPDLILMDQNMPGLDGVEAISVMLKLVPDTGIIIMTAFSSLSMAVKAGQKGAVDYIEKPFELPVLLKLIQNTVTAKPKTNETAANPVKKDDKERKLIGESQAIRNLYQRIDRISSKNTTVLILGESGTGKELVAREIHSRGPRKDKPLVTINCGAIPENLIESELFGHERGSFTDARTRRIGKFEHAHNGTLFLDEIGELSLSSQVKLLRVLEDRKITRVGSNTEVPVDVRIIAATNRDLLDNIRQGMFRMDLYYRLNVFMITIPPLRERKDDVPLLVEYFIKKHQHQHQSQLNA